MKRTSGVAQFWSSGIQPGCYPSSRSPGPGICWVLFRAWKAHRKRWHSSGQTQSTCTSTSTSTSRRPDGPKNQGSGRVAGTLRDPLDPFSGLHQTVWTCLKMLLLIVPPLRPRPKPEAEPWRALKSSSTACFGKDVSGQTESITLPRALWIPASSGPLPHVLSNCGEKRLKEALPAGPTLHK